MSSDLVDLTSQSLEAEIAGLPGEYRPPNDALFIATDKQINPLDVSPYTKSAFTEALC
jgi:hypothetical protein